MVMTSGGREKTVTPLNSSETLYETGSREVWQLPLYSSDGVAYGVVIRQIIEPRMYTVRYLVIYSPEKERHFVLPATTLLDITPEAVISDLTKAELDRLPPFHQSLSRREEAAVHQTLNRVPYWIEEEQTLTPQAPKTDM